jgi:hypothetical protein
LSGGGTKQIPISRPVVLTRKKNGKQQVLMVFRDSERSDKASVSVCNDLAEPSWTITDLNKMMVGSWEPSCDKDLWLNRGIMHLFLQNTVQIDGEGLSPILSQPVYVLESSGI